MHDAFTLGCFKKGRYLYLEAVSYYTARSTRVGFSIRGIKFLIVLSASPSHLFFFSHHIIFKSGHKMFLSSMEKERRKTLLGKSNTVGKNPVNQNLFRELNFGLYNATMSLQINTALSSHAGQKEH